MKLIIVSGLLLLTAVISHIDCFANISVVNGLIHQYKIEEGKSYLGFIEVQNSGDHAQSIRILKNDFLCNSEGQVFYEEPGLNDRSNANWIKLKTSEIVIGPKEKYRLVYQIDVPEPLSAPGSYWSVIIVEPVENITLEKKANSLSVLTHIRYAVQIVCTSVKPAKAAVQFKTPVVKMFQGKRYFIVDLEDTGELFHRTKITAEFYDASTGTSGGVYKSEMQSLFPFTSKRYMLDITAMKPGEYKGVLLANCEEGNVFGLDLVLTIKDD